VINRLKTFLISTSPKIKCCSDVLTCLQTEIVGAQQLFKLITCLSSIVWLVTLVNSLFL